MNKRLTPEIPPVDLIDELNRYKASLGFKSYEDLIKYLNYLAKNDLPNERSDAEKIVLL